MTCPHALNDGPLACQRETPHIPGHGCVYTATTADLGHGKGTEDVSDQ